MPPKKHYPDRFYCYLCEIAGRDSDEPYNPGSGCLLCRSCWYTIHTVQRKRWCHAGRHVVRCHVADGRCTSCRSNQARVQQGYPTVPIGWLTSAIYAPMIGLSQTTLIRRVAAGWPLIHVKVGTRCYFDPTQTVPEFYDKRHDRLRNPRPPRGWLRARPVADHRKMGISTLNAWLNTRPDWVAAVGAIKVKERWYLHPKALTYPDPIKRNTAALKAARRLAHAQT